MASPSIGLQCGGLLDMNAVERFAATIPADELKARGLALAAELGIKCDRAGYYQTGRGKKTANGLYLAALHSLVDIESKHATK